MRGEKTIEAFFKQWTARTILTFLKVKLINICQKQSMICKLLREKNVANIIVLKYQNKN